MVAIQAVYIKFVVGKINSANAVLTENVRGNVPVMLRRVQKDVTDYTKQSHLFSYKPETI